MELACLDLEGVLVPEIWINVAERTGIEALRLTTRDIPDYDQLMRRRLGLLDQHGLKLSDIQRVIADMGPVEGAHEFLEWLRERFQVVILSDTFYEFAVPLMRQLGWPTLFCHRLEVVDDRVVNYVLRQADGKRQGGAGLPRARLPGDRRRRFLQRYRDAGGGRNRHPVPATAKRDRRVPAIPGGADLRGTTRTVP
jgi:bifunctional phosphoserine phosphatase/homoserine phosphotransferase